jgi:hypothetical protein
MLKRFSSVLEIASIAVTLFVGSLVESVHAVLY